MYSENLAVRRGGRLDGVGRSIPRDAREAPLASFKPTDSRSIERMRAHYEIERDLADRLRHAPREARRGLYQTVYDELFSRVTDHPQLTRKATPEEARRIIELQLRFLRHFLEPGQTFLEIGAGDCALSIEVAKQARKVYALDVSEAVTSRSVKPPNVEVVISDGLSIPVPEGSIDLAYSNQVMEHLHPDDAVEQLGNIARALRPGGLYVCTTPNRLTGPHDISGHFEDVPPALHLQEYTTAELEEVFRKAGFETVTPFAHALRRTAPIPRALVEPLEWALGLFPRRVGRRVAQARPFRWFMGVHVAGRKRTI